MVSSVLVPPRTLAAFLSQTIPLSSVLPITPYEGPDSPVNSLYVVPRASGGRGKHIGSGPQSTMKNWRKRDRIKPQDQDFLSWAFG